MGLLLWALFGLIAGALAKWIMPGEDPGGWFKTMLIGVGGAWLGGFLGSVLGLGSITGFNFGSMALAVGGACLLLWIFRKIDRA